VLWLRRHNRSFLVFLVTQGVSQVGDSMSAVVVPLLVLQLTHSAVLVAALALLETAPRLALELPAGALVDRWDRRRVQLAADVCRGVLTLLAPAAVLAHGPVVLVLFATAVPMGALSCLFNAAFQTMAPALAGRERVDRAYALIEGCEALAWVAGPALAGLLVVAAGGATALALDGGSFLLAAAGMAAVRTARIERPAGRRSLAAEMADGLRYLVTSRILRRAHVSWTLYIAISSGVVAGLVYVGSRGGAAGPALASAAVTAYAAGTLLGTLLAGWRRPSAPSVVAAACLASVALGALLVASGRGLAIPMGGLLLGLGEGEFRVVFLTLRAEATPDALMGRVSSAGRLVVYGAGGIGVAWVSLFLQWLGGPAAFGLLAVLALALAG